MGILRFLYVILHFFITYFHRFHVASSELIDRLKAVLTNRTYRRWPAARYASTAKLDTSKNDETLLLQTIGCELKRLQKLPSHVACLFTEQDVNIDKIVTVIEWCAAMGISCISLYDHQSNAFLVSVLYISTTPKKISIIYLGCIISCQDTIKTKLKSISANFSNGLKSKSFSVHKGFVTKQYFNPGIKSLK